MGKLKASETVYQLKVTLAYLDPPIWRRVQTRDLTLEQLNAVIQECFGWEFSHLWQFEVKRKHYSSADFGLGELEMADAAKVKLGGLVTSRVKKFTYTYDFGDNWEHEVLIEKRLSAEPGVRYPRCVEGENAAPPEDCGGPFGYPDFVAAMTDPKHPEHEEMREWYGREFDPYRCDLKAINRRLARLG